MRERFINRTFADPTANAAIGRILRGETTLVETNKPVTQRVHQSHSPKEVTEPTSVPCEETRRQVTLKQLNRFFPGERKKAWRFRDPEFNRLRDEIMNGNYDVFNRTREGGV